uniref:Uncharacterized protein n=1 Tax=Vespula pensylvanica TaxID=30213 RepID=A0A834P1S7_VESPE|nr:hypothetical protein H0235_007739 [Vespula pensylvanica]
MTMMMMMVITTTTTTTTTQQQQQTCILFRVSIFSVGLLVQESRPKRQTEKNDEYEGEKDERVRIAVKTYRFYDLEYKPMPIDSSLCALACQSKKAQFSSMGNSQRIMSTDPGQPFITDLHRDKKRILHNLGLAWLGIAKVQSTRTRREEGGGGGEVERWRKEGRGGGGGGDGEGGEGGGGRGERCVCLLVERAASQAASRAAQPRQACPMVTAITAHASKLLTKEHKQTSRSFDFYPFILPSTRDG